MSSTGDPSALLADAKRALGATFGTVKELDDPVLAKMPHAAPTRLVLRQGDAMLEVEAYGLAGTGPLIRVLSGFAMELSASPDLYRLLNDTNILYPETTLGVYPTAPDAALVNARCMAATFGSLISDESIVRCALLCEGLANGILSRGFVRQFGGRVGIAVWMETLGLPAPELQYPDAY